MAQSNSETYIDTRNVAFISKEETNYLRIANVLLRVAPPIVRQKFDRELYPGVLQTVLNQNRFKVLTELSKRHVINKKQWELLFPQKGDASSITFDLNLMLVLIRHLTPIEIGDKPPVSSLTDEGADLTRLKYYRNELTHNEDGALTDSVFEKWWNDICQAIIRLGGQQYQQKCVELKERRLDGNDREILTELRNIDKTNDPIPVGMKHVNYKTVKEWKDLQDTVYETRAIRCLRKMIKENDIVTVIGSPGCGKTTAIRHIAIWLHREEGYDIFPAYKPSDIRQYYDPKRQQLFVFDDVCGKFSLHLEAVRDWSAFSECIQKIVDENLTKILVSCRSYIFLQFTSVKLLSSSVCNFISPDNELTKVERYEIAKSYLTEDETNTLKGLKDFNKYDFFPLLCKFYAKNRTGDICKFFSSPEDVIKEDLMAFMNETDQTAYGTLALFVIYNNFITKELLSRKSKLNATLLELSQVCKMTNYFSITVVEKQLDSFTRSYAKKTDNGYSIIHDKLFDILVSFYGTHMFDLILDLCHKDILRDRYHFESVNEKHVECFVMLTPEQEGKYLQRLFQHFEEGHIDVVFENRLIKYEVYRNKVIKFLHQNEKLSQCCTLSTHDKKSPVLTIATQGHSDILQMLIDLKFDVNLSDEHGTPLYRAAVCGHISCVELLLRNNADPNKYTQNYYANGQTPLYVASEIGRTNIVRLLLSSNADPNICDANNRSPLYIASRRGHTEIVQVLLINHCDPNICDALNQTPLYVASDEGHTDIVQMLLSNNGNPNICDLNNRSPLYIVSDKGYTDIVQLLLSNNGNPNICDDENKSPLHVASFKGQTDIVQLLLSSNVNPNIFAKNNICPLIIASYEGHTDIVQILLSNNGNPNICDGNNRSPLYIASDKGHTDIVQLLLSKNGNPNICDDKNRSPLYIASFKGHTDIVQLLLSNNGNPNICDGNNRSPLYIASDKGHADIVQLLLSKNGNPNICEYEQNLCPLYIASKKGHTDIVQLLLSSNGDPNICDADNRSPLYVASDKGHTEIVQLLLSNNGDPNKCNAGDRSPLYVASDKGHTDTVYLLLNYNADPNIFRRDIEHEGETPLYSACLNGHTEIVQLLLKKMLILSR